MEDIHPPKRPTNVFFAFRMDFMDKFKESESNVDEKTKKGAVMRKCTDAW